MKFEITNKRGEISIVDKNDLPKFSTYFNKLVKELKINESMYDITSMTNIKRIE